MTSSSSLDMFLPMTLTTLPSTETSWARPLETIASLRAAGSRTAPGVNFQSPQATVPHLELTRLPPLRHYLSAGHDRDPVAEVVCLVQEVRREDHSEPPLTCPPFDVVQDLPPHYRSMPTVGSSRKRISMSCRSSLATWSLFFWPPDSSKALDFLRGVQVEEFHEFLRPGLRNLPGHLPQGGIDLHAVLNRCEVYRFGLLHNPPYPLPHLQGAPSAGQGPAPQWSRWWAL